MVRRAGRFLPYTQRRLFDGYVYWGRSRVAGTEMASGPHNRGMSRQRPRRGLDADGLRCRRRAQQGRGGTRYEHRDAQARDRGLHARHVAERP